MPVSEEGARLKGCFAMILFIGLGIAVFWGIILLVGFLKSF
tara:strand:+ start:911 stop:1033 length:123 start_codon:yes stop_codon:yes gene_type:complete